MIGTKVTVTPVAESVPFDNSNNDFIADDVQTAIEEINAKLESGASPGFMWDRSGNVPAGSYLLNGSRPSNISGKTCPINGVIVSASITQENDDSFSFKIQKRVNSSFVDLGTVAIVSSRKSVVDLNITITKDDELCVMIYTGSPKNPGIDLLLKGTL
jgi:hypothetical protein